MATIVGTARRFTGTGGPYTWIVVRDQVGLQSADNQANANAAFDAMVVAMKAALPGGSTVDSIEVTLVTIP